MACANPIINVEPERETQPDERRAAKADVLLVEDDLELGMQTTAALRAAGYEVRHALNLAEAAMFVAEKTPALLVLDRMLPDGEGLDFLRSLKARGFDRPSMVLSALSEVDDRVEGLNNGADDYLIKPFDYDELSARVAALLRRGSARPPLKEITVGDLSIDLLARTAMRGGIDLELQPREFKLIVFLAENSGNIVTKDMLLREVWGLEFDPQTNVVEVHISRLRAKLDRGKSRKLLHTIRGNGYSLRP